jgi:Zn-dependent peptidase ImmA (M78 family)/DNA-binding XRE family transcriptional regulator
MSFSGKRIQSARLRKGYSLQDLADQPGVDVTRQAIHKYERGQSEPSMAVIRQLATALEVKAAYFYRDTPIELGRIAFRKLASFPKKEQNKVIETAREMLERYLELEEILGLTSEMKNPISDISVTSAQDVEVAAEALREAWELGHDPLFNILELLEDKGVKIIELESDQDFDGASTYVGKNMPVIVLNRGRKKHLDRYRFTALHELGHLLLNFEDPDLHHKTEESLCNRFAGALLIPKDALVHEFGGKRHHLGLKELAAIKQQYGISVAGLVYRMRDLEFISQPTYRSFFKMLSTKGFKKDERELAEYEGQEKALRFEQLLSRAVHEEEISVSKAAEMNNQTEAQFRKEFYID